MARSPDPEVHRWWTQFIRNFEPDHETVARYCQRHDVSGTSFYQWRRKLGADRPQSFVPVEVASPAQQTAAGEVIIEMPSGANVRLPGRDRELIIDAILALAQVHDGEAQQ